MHINSDEISAAVKKCWARLPAGLTPDTNVGDAAPTIKDQQVTYDGDTVHGQFLTQIAGKDVWITISGHLGQKDGYATFDPTEFKVGDLDMPVSLVNRAAEEAGGGTRSAQGAEPCEGERRRDRHGFSAANFRVPIS